MFKIKKISPGRPLFLKLLIVVLIAGLVFFLFCWRLDSYLPGASAEEISAIHSSSSIKAIVDNPLYLPHKLIQFGLISAGAESLFWMRFASVIFGVVACFCFYYALSRWFSRRISILTSLALATTPLFLITSRLATPTILMAWAFCVIMAAYLWLASSKRGGRTPALLALAASVGLVAYIPGIFLAVFIGGCLFFRRIWSLAKAENKVLPFLLVILMLAFLSPLIYASLVSLQVFRQLLLLPESWLPPMELLQAIIWAGLGLFWRTRDNINETLATLPLLSLIASILLVFGVVYVLREYKRMRSYALFAIVGTVVFFSGINADPTVLLIALPVIFVLIAGGLSFLLEEWLSVFPRNPFAKILAVSLIVMAVGIHAVYGARYALWAWPQAVETTVLYQHELKQ